MMMVFTRLFGSWALTGTHKNITPDPVNKFVTSSLTNTTVDSFSLLSAFTGAKNAEIVPAANTYVQVHTLLS